MASMGKDIYKTLKRSISGKVGEASSSQSTSSVKYGGGSGSTWIHPPDVLINGQVEYQVRFLGTTEVPKSRGADIIRAAIERINFQRTLHRPEVSHSLAKLQKVELHISIDRVIVIDFSKKAVLHSYPLSRISFCADDKQDKRVFSFIARSEADSSRHDCFVFVSEKLAEQITLTVGEAFDLAYKRFLDKNRSSLENQKQIFILRKRIAELESENQVLSERLAGALRGNQTTGSGLLDAPIAPALPSSPMPHAPPANLAIYASPRPDDLFVAPTQIAPSLPPTNGQSSSSPSGPAPTLPPPRAPALAPPPPVAPRRNQLPKSNSMEKTEKVEDVFDDSFDPRAGEIKQNNGSYDPFGEDFLNDVLEVGDSAAKATAADFQAMIDKVDQRLAQMSSGEFAFDKLETGQLSPSELAELGEESVYGTPSDKLNPQVVGLKKT